jgi:hypothetical protein
MIVCGSNERCCSGKCTGADVNNCGGCGNLCVFGDLCCPSGGGFACVAVSTSNCGGCGVACAAMQQCCGCPGGPRACADLCPLIICGPPPLP